MWMVLWAGQWIKFKCMAMGCPRPRTLRVSPCAPEWKDRPIWPNGVETTGSVRSKLSLFLSQVPNWSRHVAQTVAVKIPPARQQFMLVQYILSMSLQVSRALILPKWLLLKLIDPFHSAVVIWLEWDIYHTLNWSFKVSKTTICLAARLGRGCSCKTVKRDSNSRFWVRRPREGVYNQAAIDGSNSTGSFRRDFFPSRHGCRGRHTYLCMCCIAFLFPWTQFLE